MTRAARVALIAATALAGFGFAALAAWQFQRLGWKQDLIARVEQRLQAEPVSPPGTAAWPAIGKADEYRRLRLRGQFERGEVLVQATTALGGGFWVLAPLSETGGGPLRRNAPSEGRWYSRDVAGIAAQLGVAGPVAPFFVDESTDPAQPQRWPRPGLTVIRFANNHAVYAATWLALAAMAAAAAGYLLREERRRTSS
jgi:surfeit locus 1 family protein